MISVHDFAQLAQAYSLVDNFEQEKFEYEHDPDSDYNQLDLTIDANRCLEATDKLIEGLIRHRDEVTAMRGDIDAEPGLRETEQEAAARVALDEEPL